MKKSDILEIKNLLITEKNIGILKNKENKIYNIKKLLGNNNLTQSQSIRFGNVFQDFIINIAKKYGAVIHYNEKIIKIGKKNKDVDVCFTFKGVTYYFECKTNLNLDSEKSKSTDEKVEYIHNFIKSEHNNLISGVLTCWYSPNSNIYNKLLTKVYYMSEFFDIFNVDIDENDYNKIMLELGTKL